MLRYALPLPLLLAAAFGAGCTNISSTKPFQRGDTGSTTDTDTGRDTADTSDTGQDTSDTGRDTSDTSVDTADTAIDTGGDTSTPSTSEFDAPGDVVTFDEGSERQSVDLSDRSGDSNADQEFFLVLVNTGASASGYSLRYQPVTEGATPPSPPARPRRAVPSETRPHPAPTRHARAAAPPPPLADGDIGTARDEFLVRDDLYDTESYAVVNARLWALGENVAIWVDEDVPIDWDVDCDGVVDVPDRFDAYGFDNCDLATVADIIDGNIVPNVRALYGDESDLDLDGRVAVVISPVLNAITLSSTDDSDYDDVLSSYAEPAVDLQPYNARTNPGSDEAEVVYVFAPDPYGFFNPNTGPTVEDYTSYQLAAEVARSFTTLVTYNQKVVIGESSVETDWLNDALGTFAADYCGFGANFYGDAWEYLDATHLAPLVRPDDPGNLGTLSRGAQYTYARWLYDAAEARGAAGGVALMNSIVQRSEVGIDAMEIALWDGLSMTFAETVVAWQVALLTTGQVDTDGYPLVDSATWAPYAPAASLDAPPDDARGFYGANGYQVGLAVDGVNRAFTGGTTATPEELVARAVRMGNVDTLTFSPGFDFNGYVGANYATQVVRLVGPTFDTTALQIQAAEEGLIGAVVRWNDPTTADWAIEDSFSATDANAMTLPMLPSDGSTVHGIGRITLPGSTYVVTAEGEESLDVADTDRWRLDLRDRPSSETVTVTAWLERRYSDMSGGMELADPWLAIVPEDVVPLPTVDGTTSGACADGEAFAYPTSVLEYLYSQVFLASALYDGTEADLDACGVSSGSTTCDADWDRDGVLDADEPLPTSFLGQVRVMECTANGNVAPSTWSVTTDNLDIDELDDDSEPTYSFLQNTGGRAGEEGEEGYVQVDLQGGRTYLVVVGASSGDGTYELSVRQLVE